MAGSFCCCGRIARAGVATETAQGPGGDVGVLFLLGARGVARVGAEPGGEGAAFFGVVGAEDAGDVGVGGVGDVGVVFGAGGEVAAEGGVAGGCGCEEGVQGA